MRQMSEKISYYMDEISRAMQQLADGNLDILGCDAFQGDFRPVQEALSIVVSSLNETMTEINTFSDQVASGSDQVAGGAQVLSQGCHCPGRLSGRTGFDYVGNIPAGE